MPSELTADRTRRVMIVEMALRVLQNCPDRAVALTLVCLEVEAALADLRGADEPFGVALVELLLGSLRAEQLALQREAAAAAEAVIRQEARAEVLDVPRQLEHLEAEGGASDLSVADWLSHAQAGPHERGQTP